MNEIARLYQAFDPLRPLTLLPAEDNLYVDWQKQISPDDIKKRLSNSILNAGSIPVQRLLTGHRGTGKTTELLRVKKILEDRGCFVSMLQAETWLDLADVRAPDLIYNMVQQIASDLQTLGYGFGFQRVTEFVRNILDTEVTLSKFDIKADPV